MENNVRNTIADSNNMEALKKRISKGNVFMIIGGVILVFFLMFMLMTAYLLGTIAALLGLFFLFYGGSVRQKAMDERKNIANNYARDILAGMMDRLDEFEQNKGLDSSYVGQDMGYPEYDTICRGGDYVKGVFRGIPLEFSEIELQYTRVSYNEDDDEQTSYYTAFRGLMVVCRHNLTLNEPVLATQFMNLPDTYRIGNDGFDNSFSVRCSYPQDVAAVFSSEYIEKLLTLTTEKGKRFAVRFTNDGLLLAVIQDLDLFEAGKTTNTTQLVEKLETELKDFAHMVELLTFPAKQ